MRVRIFGTLSLSLLFVITFSVALVTTGLAQPPDETPVTFPDANLEAAIREAIDKPEGLIFTSDLDELTSLKTKGITDLTGLEYCSNLTEQCNLTKGHQLITRGKLLRPGAENHLWWT